MMQTGSRHTGELDLLMLIQMTHLRSPSARGCQCREPVEFCCFCWRCAFIELSDLVCSQYPDLNEGTQLGSLLGSAASEPLHLQGWVLLVECAATAAATAGFLLPRTGLN
jgi:hypothetical protein